ncbi:hypothetical protein C1645_746273, partial [Glomus cerebriforme]
MSFDYWQELVSDYEKLLETGKGHDMIIYAGENENESEIYVHSNILRTRYIYCGKIDLTKLDGLNILKLLIAVDELNIQTLINCTQNYLIENESEVIYQNVVEILELAYQPHVIEMLLKRDDLDLEEIVVWDNLITWCHVQHPTIPRDATNWNKEQITIMERVLNRFIPLIRFYQISSNDFFYKVLPYKKLLPKKLIYDILEFHLSSSKDLNVACKQLPRQMKNLVDYRHFIIFASWIDRKNTPYYNRTNMPYSFNLLYRASQDGMGLEEFHEKCDNKEKTLVVAKVKDSEQLVGGYNPLVWDKNGGWENGENSFLFSFVNRKKIETAKLGINNNKEDQEIIGN